MVKNKYKLRILYCHCSYNCSQNDLLTDDIFDYLSKLKWLKSSYNIKMKYEKYCGLEELDCIACCTIDKWSFIDKNAKS